MNFTRTSNYADKGLRVEEKQAGGCGAICLENLATGTGLLSSCLLGQGLTEDCFLDKATFAIVLISVGVEFGFQENSTIQSVE